MIRIWRGYHSDELRGLVANAWSRSELLILCPPLLKDFRFLNWLPPGDIQWVGDWDGASLPTASRTSSPEPYPEIPVLGVFTTGTASGMPRLIIYSKKNIEASLEGVRSFFDPARIGSIFCYPQPFHTFGLILGYLQSLIYDLELIVPTGRYSRQSHESRLSTSETNLLTLGTPTHFHDLAAVARERKVTLIPTYSSIAGGAKVSVATWKAMRNELHIEMPSIGYGATEAAPAITHLPPGQEPIEDGEIGFSIPGIDVSLSPGKGLEFSGPNACLAIIQGADGIEFPDRILIRDDIERRGTDGVMLYRGRHELLLNRGGAKLSLERIEEWLRDQAQLETICVALPDERLGEELGVVVRTRPGVTYDRKKISATLGETFGHSFNPALWIDVPEFPVNASAKTDRKACAALLVSTSISFPVPVSRLTDWLPHRAPAIWIDSVTWVTDHEGECLVIPRADSRSRSEDGIRPSSLIEWIAQSYGFVSVCQTIIQTIDQVIDQTIDQKLNGSSAEAGKTEKKPDRAFLVAIRNAEWFDCSSLRAPQFGQSFKVRVKKNQQIGPISLIDGTVTTHDEKILLKAQLRLYAE